jgi:4-diphosphocytidyl-2-C-methyl-D-erythritol kinase
MIVNAKANAKINLYLEVLGKRTDGYHDIETIMQEIDLSDELEFNFVDENKIDLHVEGPYAVSGGKDNLVYKACELIKKEFKINQGVEIRLIKNIPFGAGLGGGSSDAATCIKVLCQKWNITTNQQDLCNMTSKLGADIPFFLLGGRCFAEGIGEKLTQMKNAEKYPIVLVFPNIELPTKAVYKKLTKYNKKCSITKILDRYNARENLFNRLEEPALTIAPEIENIKKLLIDLGATSSLMSGSGSSVFGITPSLEIANAIKNKLSKSSKYSVWALNTL